MNDDARRHAPAVARNREPILTVLRGHLPRRGLVLEVASGTGEHAAYFARASDPDLVFQPSDADPGARTSIDAWTAALGLSNVRPALAIDATSANWPISFADAVLSINVIHIAPWAATIGLLSVGLRAYLGRVACSISTVLSAAAVDTRRRATNTSTWIFAGEIPRGASATSRSSRRRPLRTVSRLRWSKKCPPTICRSFFDGKAVGCENQHLGSRCSHSGCNTKGPRA